MIPNTTPTPNELYNGEMKKMTDTELRVVLIVTRATLGWEEDKETKMRKKEDWISYYQLKQKSGRGYTALSQAIDNCIKKGWIEARDREGKILDVKEKRHGKRIYYRLGRIFLDTIEVKPTSSESERVEQTSSESESAESESAESEAYKRNTITKETSLQNIVGKADDAFLFKNKLDEMTKDKQKHIQIIALYWQIKGFNFENKEQYQAALKRELRPARQLVGYSMDQIQRTMEILKNTDYLTRFTLETVGKYITDVVVAQKKESPKIIRWEEIKDKKGKIKMRPIYEIPKDKKLNNTL